MSDTVACKAINGAMQKAGLNFAQLSERSGINETRVSSSALPCSPCISLWLNTSLFLDAVCSGRETATDDEFKKLSSALNIPVRDELYRTRATQ